MYVCMYVCMYIMCIHIYIYIDQTTAYVQYVYVRLDVQICILMSQTSTHNRYRYTFRPAHKVCILNAYVFMYTYMHMIFVCTYSNIMSE